MAGTVITDAQVTVGATDVSAYVQQVELSEEFDELDVTNMASGGRRERVAGLGDATVSIEFFSDWDASGLNETIEAVKGTVAAVTVQRSSAAVGADNPTYTFDALINDWTPLSAGVGEVSMSSVTWPVSGAITLATT